MDLSREQFMGLGQELAGGGFSRKVAGPGAGSSPSGNVDMVGGYKGILSDYPEEPGLTDEDLYQFASQPGVPEVLAEPNVYLGGYIAEDPVRQSVDVSKAYATRDPKARYEGRMAAAITNQESIGRIRKGQYTEPPISYPYYISGASQAGRDPDLFDAAWAASRGGQQTDAVWAAIKQAAPETSPSPQQDAPEEPKYNPRNDPNAMQIPGMDGM